MFDKSSRRKALVGTAAFTSIGLTKTARAAEFQYRYGHDQTVDSCVHVRAVQMANDVKRDTKGRLEIQVFPNSILGSDPAMIEQVRVGALQFSCQTGPLLAGVAPAAALSNVPYAFKSEEQAIAAQNSDLGAAVRKDIALKYGFHVFPVIVSTGYRQITSNTRPIRNADDLIGFKIRTLQAPSYVEFYKTMGAQVTPISVAEVYTALQTRLVDGQDSPYAIIETQRFYEVQKYLSVMDAMWGCQYFYCNGDAWRALPPDIQTILDRHVAVYGKRSANDNLIQNKAFADKLRRHGLIFNVADRESFKAKLGPWYAKQKAIFGPSLWALLENYAGRLG